MMSNLRPIVVQLPAGTHGMLLEVAARRGTTAADLAPDLLGAGLALLLAPKVDHDEPATPLALPAPDTPRQRGNRAGERRAERAAAAEPEADTRLAAADEPAPVPVTVALSKVQRNEILSWASVGHSTKWIARQMGLDAADVRRVRKVAGR